MRGWRSRSEYRDGCGVEARPVTGMVSEVIRGSHRRVKYRRFRFRSRARSPFRFNSREGGRGGGIYRPGLLLQGCLANYVTRSRLRPRTLPGGKGGSDGSRRLMESGQSCSKSPLESWRVSFFFYKQIIFTLRFKQVEKFGQLILTNQVFSFIRSCDQKSLPDKIFSSRLVQGADDAY